MTADGRGFATGLRADEVAPGHRRAVVELEGRSLCVGHTEDGEWGAIDNVCTHDGGDARRRRAGRRRGRVPAPRRPLRPLHAGACSPCHRCVPVQRLSRPTSTATRSWWTCHEDRDPRRVRHPGPGRAGARRGETAPLARRASPSAEKLPHAYLEQLVGDLRRAGLVTATRGQSGGYRLARPAERDQPGRRDPRARRADPRDAVRRARQPRGLRPAAGLQRPRGLRARPRLARRCPRRDHPGRGGRRRPAARPIRSSRAPPHASRGSRSYAQRRRTRTTA